MLSFLWYVPLVRGFRKGWQLCVSESANFRWGTNISAVPTILAFRRDPRLLRLPPYLSALLLFIGVVWLFLLPFNQYSRHTYISENALLPGQVHTYFAGSEQTVFNAYRHEIRDVIDKDSSA